MGLRNSHKPGCFSSLENPWCLSEPLGAFREGLRAVTGL